MDFTGFIGTAFYLIKDAKLCMHKYVSWGSLVRRCIGSQDQNYAVLTGTCYGRPAVAMARGVTPTAKGEPLTVVSAPEALLIANAKTSLEP
jgi:hypothetical protein